MRQRDDAVFLRLLQTTAIASNEASDIRSAASVCLDETRRAMGWSIGHLYVLSEDGQWMEPSGVWSVDDPDTFAPFQQVTNTLRLPIGKGVPGQVLLGGRPHWILDVAQNDPDLPRAAAAASVGLRGGLAFPILTGTAVSGALEFYAAEVVQPDESLLEILAQVGRQLGRVVERERAARELRASEARF